MVGETQITITGNITADPELRITESGTSYATFTVAATRRYRDGAGQWTDAAPLFLRVTVWRAQAENVAESLHKGARVTVTGRLRQRSYENRDGQQRTVLEIDASEVAASLRFATATLVRNSTAGNDNTASSPTHSDDGPPRRAASVPA